MLKKHSLSTIKLFFVTSVMLLVLIGCGGGGSQSNEAIQNNTTQSETIQSQDPITLNIQVSPHIVKIAYLPKVSEDVDAIYSIDNTLTEGNVTLLDEITGRYSYLSSENVNLGQDRFSFKVIKGNNTLLSRMVNVYICQIDVKLNKVVQHKFSSNLPIVIIDTGDKAIPDEPKIKGSMTIIEPLGNKRSHLQLQPNYSGYMEIEVRGFSSQRFPKKQYSVDTETVDEEDDDVSLLSMPKEHKWILHAPYSDKSLMRNYVAYHKTRDINVSKYYAVRSRYVELLVRTKEFYRYEGVYVLMEKIKRDKNRLAIKKLDDKDVLEPKISGGYILQQDRAKEEDATITGFIGQKYVIEYPKANKMNTEQFSFIEDHIWKFESALHTADYNNTASENDYREWIDIDSFIVHLLAREFFRDFDNWRTSEYFYKNRSAPLVMGPVWDFNLGMGNCIIGYSGRTDGWGYTDKVTGVGYWADRLMMDPDFRKNVSDKWKLLRQSTWSDSNLTEFIDTTKEKLSEAALRNFERWPILGKKVFLERKACTKGGDPIYCDTFESAVDAHLKVWLLERAKWIDAQFQ